MTHIYSQPIENPEVSFLSSFNQRNVSVNLCADSMLCSLKKGRLFNSFGWLSTQQKRKKKTVLLQNVIKEEGSLSTVEN